MDLLQTIKEDNVEMAEWIVKQQLEKDKTNVNLWLKLALIELQLPFEDYESALKCIKEIYQLSPNHLEALILEAEIHWHYLAITGDLAKRLSEVTCNCKEKQAMILYLLSLYYYTEKDIESEKINLEKSIQLCDQYVYPYKRLGYLLSESNHEKSKEMFCCALKNVKKVYKDDDFYDFTDFDTYVAEFVTGTAISSSNYEFIKELAEC
ncbi:hypothetical protein NDGK_01756 [Clostridiales bacterium CHKCI001]|nr:hypothetical protein NDGK_01756 [Clostridiales bacterium CHKCI001]